MQKLTLIQKKVLKVGAGRLGINASELEQAVEDAAAGRTSDALSSLKIGFTAFKSKPTLAGYFPPLSFDPEITEAWSLGWSSSRQRNASRFDGRDISAFNSALWYRFVPLMVRLPARLVLNIFLADLSHTGGTGELITSYHSWGMLTSEDDFVDTGKYLSNAAKLGASWLDEPNWYKECATLVGCRYPDENTDARVSDLIREEASIEQTPHPDAFEAYKQIAANQKFTLSTRIEKFDSYVKNMSWQTDGSATATGIDPLTYEFEGKKFKLRLTKSLIPYATTFQHVLDSVKNLSTETAVIVKAILKLGETSKDRVIYPYPLTPTIIKSYLLAHLAESSNYPLDGRHPENRTWNTSLGSKGWEEIIRHARTLSVVAPDIAALAAEKATHVYQLMHAITPYRLESVTVSVSGKAVVVLASDVKGFDKQIGDTYTTEFWDSVREVVPGQVLDSVIANRTGQPFDEYLLPPDRSVSYDNSFARKELESDSRFSRLIVRNRPHLVRNRRYLTSGTLETSKVGNRVSYCVCRGAAETLVRISPGSVEMFDVRGDDQLAAFRGKNSNHARLLARLWWVYTSAFLEYSPDKSRITDEGLGATEFLRIEYGREGAKGYLNRSLVWIGEARPFSEESGYAVCPKAVSALENCATSERRGAKPALRRFLYFNAIRALASRGFAAEILHVPRSVGGAGVMPPRPGSVKLEPVGTFAPLSPSAWSSDLVMNRFSRFGLSQAEAVSISASALNATVRADVSKIRAVYQPESRVVLQFPERVPTSILTSVAPDPTFGKMPQLAEIFEKTVSVARVREVKTMNLLTKQTAGMIRAVERKYHFPRRLAVDWLSGKISGYTGSLHPELTFICSRMVACYLTINYARRLWDARSSYLFISSMMSTCAMALQRQMSLTHSW